MTKAERNYSAREAKTGPQLFKVYPGRYLLGDWTIQRRGRSWSYWRKWGRYEYRAGKLWIAEARCRYQEDLRNEPARRKAEREADEAEERIKKELRR
jgi:hypothetical protein